MCKSFLFVNKVKKERKDRFIKYFFEWSGARVEEIDLRGKEEGWLQVLITPMIGEYVKMWLKGNPDSPLLARIFHYDY